MFTVSLCQNPHVFAMDTHAQTLLEDFCTCPAARDLIAKISDNLSILIKTTFSDTLRMVNHPEEFINFAPRPGGGVEFSLEIPEILQSADALHMLAQGILFVKKSSKMNALVGQALEGNLGIAVYAKESAALVFITSQEGEFLKKTCVPFFKSQPATGSLPTYEEFLWDTEMNCSINQARRYWIDYCQAAYCKKHPEDSGSCEIKKEDLCNLSMIPPDQITNFLQRRVCENLPSAPQTIKNRYNHLNCPEILAKTEL